MYKDVLIITDNVYLAGQFKNIAERRQYGSVTFEFSISPFSNISDFTALLGNNVRISDLRDSSTIEMICKNYDLVLSIHCKQIFPPALVKGVKCINVHPGYNPYNRGWYPQVFSIIHNLPIGATIHEIDEYLDHGKIIDRILVEKEIYDTSGSLYNKVVQEELNLIEKNIDSIIANTYTTIEPETEGAVFLKKDFNQLREIDLSEKTTAGDFINRLRALTHGEYKNAFFFDPKTGKKVFVSVNLDINE